MSYATPRLHWELARDGAPRGTHPVLEVPAELSALTPSALALLRERLAWRCAAVEVLLRPGHEVLVLLVGHSADTISEEQRAAADAALGTVAADAAAGWTAHDEAEHHRPISWR